MRMILLHFIQRYSTELGIKILLVYSPQAPLGANKGHAQSQRHALNLTNLLTADGEPMVELSGIESLT